MTWIRTTPADQAHGELSEAYREVYALYPPEYAGEVPAVRRADGASDSITAAHSLIPQALRHAMAAFGVLLSADLPLTRRQHEMIATLVSALNSCFY
jgi:alkylhydroperoxidase family enzyme